MNSLVHNSSFSGPKLDERKFDKIEEILDSEYPHTFFDTIFFD